MTEKDHQIDDVYYANLEANKRFEKWLWGEMNKPTPWPFTVRDQGVTTWFDIFKDYHQENKRDFRNVIVTSTGYTKEDAKTPIEKMDLSLVDFSGADFSFANFSQCKANFHGAKFQNCNFEGANLEGIEASLADFSGSNFTGSNLENANLGGANLDNCNLTNANLYGTIATHFASGKVFSLKNATIKNTILGCSHKKPLNF